MRVLGYFLGDFRQTGHRVLSMGLQFLPESSAEVLDKLKYLIEGPLFTGSELTLVNSFILILSSLTFTNVIWNGMYLITENEKYKSKWKYGKGLVVIFATIVLILVILIMQPLTILVVNFVKENSFTDFVYQWFDKLRPTIDWMKGTEFDYQYIFSSNLMPGAILIVFFTFLYLWLFNWKISNSQAFLGSLTFVIAVLLGKSLFLIYFVYLRDELLLRYGDFYTFVVVLIWVFQVMVFFFYSVCLCHILKQRPLKFGEKSLKMGNYDTNTD